MMPLCEHTNPDECPNHGVQAQREAALGNVRRAMVRLDKFADLVEAEEYGKAAGQLRVIADAFDRLEVAIRPHRDAEQIADAALGRLRTALEGSDAY